MTRFQKFLAKFLTALAVAVAGNAHATNLSESIRYPNATAHVVQQRVREFIGDQPAYRDDDGNLVVGRRWVPGPSGDVNASDRLPDPRDVFVVGEEDIHNVKTTAQIDFLFSQGYNSTAAAQTNGLAWVGLSNDSLTETSSSTTLSNEIAANGLSRAKGTYAHTNGQSTATNTITFTATGTQACQKAAYFSASSSGTMGHALSFTQRTLQNTDTITITLTVTLS